MNARAKGMGGATPLHLAAHGGHPDAVIALLNIGADPMARTMKDATPLRAAEMGKDNTEGDVRGHYEVIKILTKFETGIMETIKPSRKEPTPRRGTKPSPRIQPLQGALRTRPTGFRGFLLCDTRAEQFVDSLLDGRSRQFGDLARRR